MAGDVVGLIPAAGLATRLGPIPCSKEIFPVAYRSGAGGDLRPEAACESLIAKFRAAGAERVFVVLRDGKWDIPAYLGDGHRLGVAIGYLMMRFPFGQPYTLDAAYSFVEDATVLLGFPDILFDREDVFRRLLERKDATAADAVLGLFPARRPEKMDMVRMDESGKVADFVIKPEETDLTHTWLAAAWSPAFTDLLHGEVARTLREDAPHHASGRELYVGDVLRTALRAGMSIETVTFEDTHYIDIGTPNDLVEAVQRGVASPAAGPPPGPERVVKEAGTP